MKAGLPLTFAAVDGLGFAAASGRLALSQPARYLSASLGPLLELLCLIAGGRLPSPIAGGWLEDNGARPMIAAILNQTECWIKPDDRRMGVIRAARSTSDEDALFTGFLMDAQRAARDVSRRCAAQCRANLSRQCRNWRAISMNTATLRTRGHPGLSGGDRRI